MKFILRHLLNPMFWIKQRKTIFGGIAPGFKDGFQKGLRGEPLK